MSIRLIVALIGILATPLWHQAIAWGSPITPVPNTVNMFRDTRGLNDVGIGQGNLFQYGADIQGGSAGSLLGAAYPLDPPPTFQQTPTACVPLAVNQNFCGRTTAFNVDRIASRWSFTFRNGPDELIVPGPTLTDNAGAILTPVPFPVSVTMTAGTTAATPTISWVVPEGFTPDGFRVNIFDKGVILSNGQADIIHSVAISATATSYPIPLTLSSGQSLQSTGRYSVNFQLIETRNHVPFTNNNAQILRRSSSFFAFTPTNPGAPDVHLPQVGPDPNPNDNLGAPYEFSVELVGPDNVTFIDPVVAVGYDYAIGTGDPNFASIVLPNVGDGVFDVIVNGTHHTVQAGQQFFFAEGGVSAFSVRGIEASAGLDPGNVNAFITGLTFVQRGRFTGTMTPVLMEIPEGPQITALGPAKVWIGLKNSDDVGLRLDLKVEVFVNNVNTSPIGTGQLNNVSAGSSGFNNALLHTIPLTLSSGEVTLELGDRLVFRISVRRTCFGGGHASGAVRLWYNGKAIDTGAARDAASRFHAIVDGTNVPYYLRTGSELHTAAGASRTSIDKSVNSSVACSNRQFATLATWSTISPNPQ